MCVYSHASVYVVERVCIFAFGERRRRRPKHFYIVFYQHSLVFFHAAAKSVSGRRRGVSRR